MELREIRQDDLKGLLELYRQLHGNAMPEESDGLNALWQGILQDENHHIIVADDSGKIVSSCVLVIVPNLTHEQRPYGLRENVITDSGDRRRGRAPALILQGILQEGKTATK